VKVKFKKLRENAIVPRYNHETDAGIDFFSVESGEILPGETRTISTGIAWQPDRTRYPNIVPNFKPFLKLEGRSGLASRKNIDVFGGVVDADYRGEIKIVLHNNNVPVEGANTGTLFYKKGDKLAQGIIHLIPYVEIEEVEELSDTERGSDGFGSSDKPSAYDVEGVRNYVKKKKS
jgi:dUTP pyrophosphatase